tara:strand:+ start:7179 stop:7886 length:708 start_codon:yes stop_codon:yes gene_type:complete
MGFLVDSAVGFLQGQFGEQGKAAAGLVRSQPWEQAPGGGKNTYTVLNPVMPITVPLVDKPITLEGVMSERHSATSTITENPVEFGPVITDHRINRPRTFILKTVITDHPLFAPAEDWGSSQSGFTYSKAAWAKLNDIRENSHPMAVTSGLQSYNNLLITSLSCSQDVSNTGILHVTINFKEVIIVHSKTEGIDPNSVDEDIAANGRPEDDLGKANAPSIDSLYSGHARALSAGGK